MSKQKIKVLSFLILLCVSLIGAILLTSVHGDITTTQKFNMNWNTGFSLVYQDFANNCNVTFTVATGTLVGNGSFNANSEGGSFSIVPYSVGSIHITSTAPAIYLYYNGVYISSSTYTWTVGTAFILTWTYTAPPVPPTPTPIPTVTPTPTTPPYSSPSPSPTLSPPTATPIVFIQGKNSTTLYFRSDVYTTNNVTSYGLAPEDTNTIETVSNTLSGPLPYPMYGFRVWLVHWDASTTELTGGSPTALIDPLSSTHNSTWTPSKTNIAMGYDAIKVTVYLLSSETTWSPRASFISQPIQSNSLLSTTWLFNLDASGVFDAGSNLYTLSFSFGDTSTGSGISNVCFLQPSSFDTQTAALGFGNILTFIFYPYVSVFGPGAYLLILFIPTFTLYSRYKDSAPVIFLYVIFSAPIGAGIWIFIPPWASGLIDAILLLLFAGLIWRALR